MMRPSAISRRGAMSVAPRSIAIAGRMWPQMTNATD